MAEEKDMKTTSPAEEKPAVAQAEKAPAKVKKVVVAHKAAAGKPLQYLGTGRRKTSTARVRLLPGTGKFQVNGKQMEEFFRNKRLESVAWEALKLVQLESRFDVKARVDGGGINGQAEAIRHGIGRALVQFDETLRKALRDAGMLTRDPRMVERKKFGQAGARKRFQFSKR
jgi:small subunit ribosomal protein S9